MTPVTIRQFCEMTGARISGATGLDTVIRGACIDSRHVGPDNLFFALSGTRVHGIQYAAEAVSRGGIVVTDPRASQGWNGPQVIAPSPRHALQQLARRHREQSDALVIGVTGSVGKTTTRRLLTSVLSASHTGVESPANFNNELGVPLSLMQIDAATQFAVVELAACRPGEIASLCRISQPEIGIVTRVAPAHLRSFDSLNSIRQTKRELVEALGTDGAAFLNADDDHVRGMAAECACRVILFGTSADANVRIDVVQEENTRLRVAVESQEFRVRLCGRHQAVNLAAAIAVARELGMTADDIQSGLDDFRPPDGRAIPLSIGGMDVIDDTWNANPASVQAAADLLSRWQTCGQRVLILGDMLDLGEQSAALHYAIGVVLALSRIDHTLTFGRYADDIADGFLSAGGSLSRVSVFHHPATLLSMLECLIAPGDVVLIKGSRGMAMDRFVDALRQSESPAGCRAA